MASLVLVTVPLNVSVSPGVAMLGLIEVRSTRTLSAAAAGGTGTPATYATASSSAVSMPTSRLPRGRRRGDTGRGLTGPS